MSAKTAGMKDAGIQTFAQEDKKFVHPEMRDTMAEAMREGLAYWRDKSPDQIAARVRARAYIEQSVLLSRTHDIGYKTVHTCECPRDMFGQVYHWPMCDKPTRIDFVPMERQIKAPDRPYKPWIYGRSFNWKLPEGPDGTK